MEGDNSHIILTEVLEWKSSKADAEKPPNSPIINIFYSENTNMVFATFLGGQTFVGKLSADYC